MPRRGEREVRVGIFDRLFRRTGPERSEPAPGLFTARSATVPPELTGAPPSSEPPSPPEDLWDRPAPADAPPPEPVPAEVAALDAFDPDPEPTPAPEPGPEPVGHVLDVPQPEPQVDEEGRTMRVHDARLDKRPGPIRMTPSEAMALAQDGPRALRRGRPHADG